MQWTPRRIAFHVVLFVVVLVVLSAIAIWLGLGPVVHSQAGPARFEAGAPLGPAVP
jgi:predicted small integral membrane protein